MGDICRVVGGRRGYNSYTCLHVQCLTMPFRLFLSILVPILLMS